MREPDMTEEEEWDFAELERLAKKAVSWRRQMVARNLSRARAKCPTCQQPEKMVVWSIRSLSKMKMGACGVGTRQRRLRFLMRGIDK